MGIADLFLRVRALLGRKRVEGELNDELNFHLEMEARKNRARGMPDDLATLRARVQFGGVAQVQEECRERRGVTALENLGRDVRYGLRLLRKSPLFTSIAVLSLAIGIGANTAVFSLLDTVLLRMLPVRSPEQLVLARWGTHQNLDLNAAYSTGRNDGHGVSTRNVFSWTMLSAMRSESHTLQAVIGFSPLGAVNVASGGQALTTGAMVATGNYFQALGVGMAAGRALSNDDDTADGLPAAVISYRLWERMFSANPAAIGRTLYVNGEPCTVIGVAVKEFFGVSAGGFIGASEIDITLPIFYRKRMPNLGRARVDWFGADFLWIQMMGRVNPGSSEAAVRDELAAAVVANLPETARRALGSETPRVVIDPGGQGVDNLRRAYQQPLVILMAVVGLTLLMACANLAGLLLARATARQREILLRMAVGASRARLVRQLIVEGALLSAIGTATGLALAWWGVRALVALVAAGTAPIPVEVSPDARVLAFTAGISLVTTFLFALAPALRATRVDVAGGLKEDAPGSTGAYQLGAGRMLVSVQVGIALVLLACATLFTRSLSNLRSQPLGFNPTNVVLFDLSPARNGYDEARSNRLYARVTERLKEVPGSFGVSLSSERLISRSQSSGRILVEGADARSAPSSYLNFVGPDFLAVMQMPLVMGRDIKGSDIGSPARVAVINESAAREIFGGGSPLGKRFRFARQLDVEAVVVGVVKDARYDRLQGEAPATIYVPYTQNPYTWPARMTFAMRTAGNPASAIAGIRRAIAEIDPMLPVNGLVTQEAQIANSLSQERLFASLVSLFSVVTLVLVSIGLYGSVSYAVSRRTRELGVRMALGAGRLSVLRMVLGQVLLTILGGLALGLPATWMLSRIIESQLYGIKAHDPLTLFLACSGVACVALLATVVPARRAIRIDPVRALRYE